MFDIILAANELTESNSMLAHSLFKGSQTSLVLLFISGSSYSVFSKRIQAFNSDLAFQFTASICTCKTEARDKNQYKIQKRKWIFNAKKSVILIRQFQKSPTSPWLQLMAKIQTRKELQTCWCNGTLVIPDQLHSTQLCVFFLNAFTIYRNKHSQDYL